MLAETRRQKQILVGQKISKTTWFKEKDNVGFKLLSKMGWSEGEGLGASKQGDADFIQVTNKKDKRGIGFDAESSDKLAMHMDNFNSILSGLAPKSANKKPSLVPGHCFAKSEFHDVSLVRRHKLCARRLQNKNLSNKNSRDVEIVLGNFGNPTDGSKKTKKKRSEDSVSRESNAQELMRCMSKNASRLPDSETDSDEDNFSGKPEKNVEPDPAPNELRDASSETQKETDDRLSTYTSKLSVGEYFKQKMEQRKNAMKNGKRIANADSETKLDKSSKSLAITSSKGPSGFCRIPHSDSENEDDAPSKIYSQMFMRESTDKVQTPSEKDFSWTQNTNISKLSYAEYFQQKMEQKRANGQAIQASQVSSSDKSASSMYQSKDSSYLNKNEKSLQNQTIVVDHNPCEESRKKKKRKKNQMIDTVPLRLTLEPVDMEENGYNDPLKRKNESKKRLLKGLSSNKKEEFSFEKCLQDIESVEVKESFGEPPKKKRKGKKSKLEVLDDIRSLVNSDDQIDDLHDIETSCFSQASLEKKLKLAEELTQKVVELQEAKPKKRKKKNRGKMEF